MSTEQFTQEQFLQVLNEFAEGRFVNDMGWVDGEKLFSIKIDSQVTIIVRSSIHHTGTAAPSGEDSIRVWMVFPSSKSTLGGVKSARWITRVSGWEERLIQALETLQSWRELAGDCPDCGKAKEIFVSHTEKNPNREFAKCIECDTGFIWLDQAARRLRWLRDAEKKMQTEHRPMLPAGADKSANQSSNGKARKDLSVPTGSKSLVATQAEQEVYDQFFGKKESAEESSPLGFLNENAASEIPVDAKESSLDISFTPSKYQEAVFDFVKNSTRNGVIEAVAGSGKTTTIVRALEFTDPKSKVGFLAFNKHIANTLKDRAPSHVHTSTLHSLGFKNLRRALGNNLKVDDRKLWNLAKRLFADNEELKSNLGTILRLVDLCKGTLREPMHDIADNDGWKNLDWLCDHYGLSANDNEEIIYEAVSVLFGESLASIERDYLVDFEDMIYLCAIGQVPCEEFDLLFIDEAQDLNAAQIAMALKSGKRIVAVGDRAQSIYGFRGADTEAIPNLIKALDAITLPLSVSYRCPIQQIKLAKQIVPQIEWRDGAPEGLVEYIPALMKPQAGDLILCRTNAPLVRPCFELIAAGIKAAIRGRDVGTGLIQLLDKSAKKVYGNDLATVFQVIREYVDSETTKLLRVGKNSRAQALQDQFETLLALSDGCLTVQDVKDKIFKVFSDDEKAIMFSSIHRAKGDEAKRVFILRPDLLPHPMARKEWEMLQEDNLKYVAITRSMDQLYFVEGGK